MKGMEIEKTNRMNALFEFYAALLTDKQMNYIELYYACLLYTSRLTCQIFEQQLLALSNEERKKFPICKYRPTDDMIQGIFSSIDDRCV